MKAACIVLGLLMCAPGATPASDDAGTPGRGDPESSAPEYFLRFTLGQSPADDPRIDHVIHGHCGGPYAMAAVSHLPDADPVLQTQKVVQFDDQARVLHQWRIPAEWVTAISGDVLYFAFDSGQTRRTYQTRPDGSISLTDPATEAAISALAEPQRDQYTTCPQDLAPLFRDDLTMVICERVKTLEGPPARIALETTCP